MSKALTKGRRRAQENFYQNSMNIEDHDISQKKSACASSHAKTISIVLFLVLLVLLLAIFSAVVVILWSVLSSAQLLEALSEGLSLSESHLKNTSGTAEERYRDVQRVISAGWQFFDGSFYFFSQAAKSWEDAEESCTEYRAHLASVTSQREMEYLLKETGGKKFWIGLTDKEEEGTWVWTDGTIYNQTNSFWSSGQPDNWDQAPQQQEDCVHFQTGVLKSWNDNSCLHKFKWICKAVFT
ncbi:C-type lectin domain family 4 member F-like [Varanus komodoensis]|uniref:C-type lectin domain family 4 member F-like n=1 Tax=Varanus komodoensis TaxID=61221 RepID=UPI001CF7E597|nr:C-type lectin domain family 4 member F-like [Varanus komodoensis]